MNPAKSSSIHQRIAECMAKLGHRHLSPLATQILVRNGFCVGRAFQFEGFRAVWQLEGDSVEIYDDQGTLLLTQSAEPQVIPLRRAA